MSQPEYISAANESERDEQQDKGDEGELGEKDLTFERNWKT